MTFLYNTWYVAGIPGELDGTPLTRTILDEQIVLYRAGSGGVVATARHCPHRFAPLEQGKVIGDDIQCPYHGLRFSPSGECVKVPMGSAAPPRARLKVYPVVERYGLIWIWMGEPARADATKIADYAYLESESISQYTGYLHVDGNYQLLVDNLLDLSHAEFLHPALSSDGWAARNKATIRQDGNQITVDNIAENDNIIPFLAMMRPDMAPIGTTSTFERWDAPSQVGLIIRYAAEDKMLEIASAHFLTPETKKTTHYFISGGYDRALGPDMIAQMNEGSMHVFRTEDLPMIEAQQAFLDEADLLDKEPAILLADAAAIRVRRHLAKLIRQESRDAGQPMEVLDQVRDVAMQS